MAPRQSEQLRSRRRIHGGLKSEDEALVGQATVSLYNNAGDLAKVFDELGSSNSVKNLLTAMVTGGVLQGLSVADLLPANLAYANASSPFIDQLQRQLIDGASSALIRSAINGTSLEDELGYGLVTAFANTMAAQGADWIGQSGPQGNQTLNAFAAELAHAMVGCVAGAAKAGSGDGCAAGAIGAVVGHLTAQFVNPTGDVSQSTDTLAVAQLLAGVATALAGGDAKDVYIAANAGANAAENNWLSQKRPSMLMLSEQERYDNAVKACGAGDQAACTTRNELAALSAGRDTQLRTACAGSTATPSCVAAVTTAQSYGNSVYADGAGGITINGATFATAGPVTSPFTTSTAGQMAQSTADGLPALPVSYGAGVLGGMAATAQTTTLGIGSITFVNGLRTAGAGALISTGITWLGDPNASASTYAINAAAGSVGGVIKWGANAAAGLTNPWLPTTIPNVVTQLLGTTASQLTNLGATSVVNDVNKNGKSP